VPAGLLKGAGWLGGTAARLAGQPAMVSSGKVRELLHENWGVEPAELWREPGRPPQFGLQDGFSSTARWYREAGWLG